MKNQVLRSNDELRYVNKKLENFQKCFLENREFSVEQRNGVPIFTSLIQNSIQYRKNNTEAQQKRRVFFESNSVILRENKQSNLNIITILRLVLLRYIEVYSNC